MPKLILSMDGLVLKEISLDKPRITIGRKAENDIQIDNLAISGRHAAINVILQDAFLEDLNSTNGTYVNGQAVKKYVLNDNDVIEMGKYRLKFLRDEVEAGPGAVAGEALDGDTLGQAPGEEGYRPRAGKAHAGAPSSAGASRSGGAREPEVAVPQGRIGIVKVLSGANAGRELILDKLRTRIGKPGHQVAVISLSPDGYSIQHGEGSARAHVNGVELEEGAQRLQDGDTIELAGVKMVFTFRA